MNCKCPREVGATLVDEWMGHVSEFNRGLDMVVYHFTI